MILTCIGQVIGGVITGIVFGFLILGMAMTAAKSK